MENKKTFYTFKKLVDIVGDTSWITDGSFYYKYPTYYVIGKPVNKDQVIDLIRYGMYTNFMYQFNGKNGWDKIISNERSTQTMFGCICDIHGNVQDTSATHKYPNFMEILNEVSLLIGLSPFLDIVIRIELFETAEDTIWINNSANIDSKLFGFWAHDSKIEVLKHADARKKFNDYFKLYGNEQDANKYTFWRQESLFEEVLNSKELMDEITRRNEQDKKAGMFNDVSYLYDPVILRELFVAFENDIFMKALIYENCFDCVESCCHDDNNNIIFDITDKCGCMHGINRLLPIIEIGYNFN